MGKREDSFFIVIDSIDGAGKEVAALAAAEFFQEHTTPQPIMLNLDEYWKAHHQHPQFEEKTTPRGHYRFDYINPNDFNLIIASEPTHTEIGHAIRHEIVHQKGQYGAKFTAEMFAADRYILYKRVLLPALERGKIWIQSRSFSTSIVQQQVQAEELGEHLKLDEILAFEGNKLAMQHPPNVLIIPTIKDIENVITRTKKRKKDDNTWFETVDFQKKLAARYESAEFKTFFEKLGTTVVYVTNDSTEDTFKQTIYAVVKNAYEHS